jgi:hypothetical protein
MLGLIIIACIAVLIIPYLADAFEFACKLLFRLLCLGASCVVVYYLFIFLADLVRANIPV